MVLGAQFIELGIFIITCQSHLRFDYCQILLLAIVLNLYVLSY